MAIKFQHKNQEFFEEACKLLPSFAKRFQKACEEQWKDPTDYINVMRDCDSIGSFFWSFDIPKRDIERVEIEELKPFIWYPASKWDGNPEGHATVERLTDGRVAAYNVLTHLLTSETEFFMLIPKNKDIKPKC